MNFITYLLIGSSLILASEKTDPKETPIQLKVAIIGLSHSHVHGILGRPEQGDIKIIAIVEQNIELARRFSKDYGYSMDIVYSSIKEMLVSQKPEAVTVFGSIYDHLNVVRKVAPHGIHVMVEKPLAVNLQHAIEMKTLAEIHNIHLLTNYETTWYATNHKAYSMVVDSGMVGELRKVIVNDGHKGPIEIGVNQEFLDWLTDPILNGGGALIDFGCYGANLITWLTKGEKPESVTAVTQTIKSELYPNVEDEATIILKYPKMQGIIQASWNWPISRKDMEIYGKNGYVISDDHENLRYRLSENEPEYHKKIKKLKSPHNDPFALFVALIRGEITLQPYDLSSLENNMIVMEILDAAIKSSKSGQTVNLK